MKPILLLLALALTTGAKSQADVKAINRNLCPVTADLFISKTEVTNGEYAVFLSALKASGDKTLLAIAQIDSVKWMDKMAYNQPFVQYYHTHPAYANYPVVNVSHEAARLYCEWLTREYNAHKKRKYEKVVFRLPTEQEWMTAARGGDPEAIYPWKGPYLRDHRGAPLANFVRDANDYLGVASYYNDGAEITAPVNFYSPSPLGIFNMAGNVAEMLDDPSLVKGGSWRDTEEYLKIDSQNTWNGEAKSTVGFRYVVDIVVR